MITPVLRISSKFLFPLLVLFAAGCETQPPGAVNIQAFGPAKTNEEAWGPQATADKITQRFAGYTYTTEYLYMYFAEDGRVRGAQVPPAPAQPPDPGAQIPAQGWTTRHSILAPGSGSALSRSAGTSLPSRGAMRSSRPNW